MAAWLDAGNRALNAGTGEPLKHGGEDAGRPIEALCLAAIGIPTLSMRPASIGPVKHMLRRVDLGHVRQLIHRARDNGQQSVREDVTDYIRTLP